MVFNDIERRRIEYALKGVLEKRRPQPEIRPKRDFGCRISGQIVVCRFRQFIALPKGRSALWLLGNALLLSAAGMMAVSSAWAAESSAEPGKTIAMEGAGAVPACKVCHGENGLGNAALGAPMLAGVNRSYLARTLRQYATGERFGPTMNGIAPSLTEDQIQAISAYYAGLDAAPVDWGIDQAMLERGKQVVENGAWDDNVPACTTCHGSNAEGIGEAFPRIAGQLPAYMQARLGYWRSGKDEVQSANEALMAAVAKNLSQQDMQAAVHYLGTMAPDQGPVTGYPAVATEWPEVKYNTKDLPDRIRWERAEAAYTKQQKYLSQDDLYVHTPPPLSDIPEGEEGQMIRLGRFLFSNTQVLRGTFVNNDQNCVNCHMGEGRAKSAAPIWATNVDFPQYRNKNKHVNTTAERIAGCFTFSMNGTPPPARHMTMVALESYMKWLGKGIPSDAKLKVRGYQYLPLPEKTADYARGEVVYKENCAVCHGENGEGRKDGDRVVFPPLWGENAFNWGAGMHTLDKAAAFIKHNMPISNPDLSNQQAWDVALFMNSHERPQDPRWKGDVETTRNAHHGHACTYGLGTANGVMGDTGEPLPKPEPVEWQRWATKWATQPSD